jgi:recombination protein RecR
MPNNIDQLSELFLQFPGIGKRQARRFVYALLHKDASYINALIENIQKLKQNISQCSRCYRFFASTGNTTCPICLDANPSQLLIVEKDADLENLHKTKIYEGQYFVLGGFISSHEKKRSFARTEQLLKRIEEDVQAGTLKEVIFGLSISPEAEHTRFRLLSMIKDKYPNLDFSTLGRGLSSGTELEYSDTETLKYALESRITD